MSNSRLTQHLLRGRVGFPTALASSVGLIMASPVILTATTGFGLGGGTFAVAMLVALLLMLAQSTTFAEAACLLPTRGSVYDYLSCGLGRFFAITGTLSAYLIVHVFAGTAETMLSGTMALVNFESLNTLTEPGGSAWLVGVRHGALLRPAECAGDHRLRSRRSDPHLRHVEHPDDLRRGRPVAPARGGVAGLVRGLDGRRRPADPAVAGGHGDVHVRRLRIRHAAGAGGAPRFADPAAGDGPGVDRGGLLHVPLWRGDAPAGGKPRPRRRPAPAGDADGDPAIRRAGDGTVRTHLAGRGPAVRRGRHHQHPDGRPAADSLRDGAGWRLAEGLHLPAPALQDTVAVHRRGSGDSLPARLVAGRRQRRDHPPGPGCGLRLGHRLPAGDPLRGAAAHPSPGPAARLPLAAVPVAAAILQRRNPAGDVLHHARRG
ncbi:amino acid permease [Pseudomonas aeruginosa]|nr:amino acid permease [Pseudomonas aeruginosa]